MDAVWGRWRLQRVQLEAAVAKVTRLRMEIVKRGDDRKGFVTLPRCWVVEGTFSWFARNRRPAKDFENLAVTLATFVSSPLSTLPSGGLPGRRPLTQQNRRLAMHEATAQSNAQHQVVFGGPINGTDTSRLMCIISTLITQGAKQGSPGYRHRGRYALAVKSGAASCAELHAALPIISATAASRRWRRPRRGISASPT
jgi:hypothetical protein